MENPGWRLRIPGNVQHAGNLQEQDSLEWEGENLDCWTDWNDFADLASNGSWVLDVENCLMVGHWSVLFSTEWIRIAVAIDCFIATFLLWTNQDCIILVGGHDFKVSLYDHCFFGDIRGRLWVAATGLVVCCDSAKLFYEAGGGTSHNLEVPFWKYGSSSG